MAGREAGEGIPALGISPETAARLGRRAAGWPTATPRNSASHGRAPMPMSPNRPHRHPR